MLELFLQQILNQIQPVLDFFDQQQLTQEDCFIIVGSLFAMLILLRLVASYKKRKRIILKNNNEQENLDAIAGDDVFVTQLDLARAYIEMGERSSALDILKQVLVCGNSAQQQDAKKLIDSMGSIG